MSKRRTTGAVAALALLLAGCGSSSDAATKFAAKVSAICAATDRRLGTLTAPIASTPSDHNRALAGLVAKEIPIDNAEVAALERLKAPGSERVPYADAVAQARNDIALLPKIAKAMRSGNHQALTSITEQSSLLSQLAIASMRRLHLRSCARNL